MKKTININYVIRTNIENIGAKEKLPLKEIVINKIFTSKNKDVSIKKKKEKLDYKRKEVNTGENIKINSKIDKLKPNFKISKNSNKSIIKGRIIK
jgi:hypothetical protein